MSFDRRQKLTLAIYFTLLHLGRILPHNIWLRNAELTRFQGRQTEVKLTRTEVENH